MRNGFGGYDAKGVLTIVDPERGLYRVAGYDSGEPRRDVKIDFGLDETGYARDYEGSGDKNPENDGVFYPNVRKFLGDLATSSSIVLLHDNSTQNARRIDIEVQFDLR